MNTTTTFFSVGNGDMTLIALADSTETKILVDCNIRGAADDPEDETPDVAAQLRARLPRDALGRPYVHVFLLSHPDEDHCRGLNQHFYLGPPEDYPDDAKSENEKRILVYELWSSPVIFRRASRSHMLCEDARAFRAEAKRRVKYNVARGFHGVGPGNQVLVLGEDEDGKSAGLEPILVRSGEYIRSVNGSANLCIRCMRPVLDDAVRGGRNWASGCARSFS